MKILLDSCVWSKAQLELAANGHEVEWCGNWPADPGDAEVLRRAHAGRSVLVTLDKDFGELAIVFRQQHSGVIRLHQVPAREQAGTVLRILSMHADELSNGALVSMTRNRVRVRRADIQDE